MAIELATAYFSFLPSMAGTAAAAAPGLRALEGQAAVSGARSGALMGGALAGGIGKFVPVIGGILAGIGIADFFGDAVDAASDLNESGNAVRVTFGAAADEIERLGEGAATRLGLNSTDFNAAAVRFSSFAEGLATDGRTVADVIDEITTRGADFASVYNIEVADALAIFQSGLSGEAEPLKRFGINLLDSEVKAYAYANGIATIGTELTQAQKLQARYGLLLQATSKVQGDFANTSDQLANQQRINSALLQDSLAKIGTALLPAATAFAQFIGSEENQARLEHLVDLLIKAGPAVEVMADGLIAIADVKFGELDTFIAFFDAVADGNLSLQDTNAIFAAMPGYLQGWTNTIATVWRNVANAVIDAENVVLSGVYAIRNAIAGLLGIKGTIQIKIPHVTVGTFSTSPGRKLTGQAAGGRTVGEGWSWVGEKGPELAYMPVGARVLPNDISIAAVTEGAGRKIELNLNGVDPLTVSELVAQRLYTRLVG